MLGDRPTSAAELGVLRAGVLRAGGLALLAVTLLGSRCGDGAITPVAGTPDYQRAAVVEVPGAEINLATANLTVERTDLVVDSQLGRQRVGAVWNSADRAWRWSFELHFDGTVFTDATGARHDAAAVPPGGALPGTHWVVVSGNALKTKGGLLHRFDVASGQLAEVRWTSSALPRLLFEYGDTEAGLRLRRIVQERVGGALDPLVTVHRDPAGRILWLLDGAGRRARFSYDAEGRLEAARDPLDMEQGWPGFRYTYAGSQLASIRTSEEERFEFEYRNGRPVIARQVGETDPTVGIVWGDVVDGLHRVDLVDVLGGAWSYTSDDRGRLRETVDPLGNRQTTTWVGVRPVSRTDADGLVTRWTLENDDVTSEIQPSGNVVRFEYARDAVDREAPESTPIANIHDDLGAIETRRYDAVGRLVELGNGEGESATLEYGGDEMLRRVNRVAGGSLLYQDYTARGHARAVDLVGDPRDLEFDGVGNRTTGADPWGAARDGGGGIRSVRYDGDRNPIGYELVAQEFAFSPDDPLWLEIDYRSDGRPLRMRRPFGGDCEWDYDALGRVVARRDRVDGAWKTTHIELDTAGRTTAIERPNGMREEWEYDPLGRVVRHAVLRDGVLESDEVRSYQGGRLVALSDSLRPGTEHRVYDAAGRLAIIVFPEGEQLWLDYDARSRIVAERYLRPELSVLTALERRYDLADREVELLEDGETLLDRTYVDGLLTRTRYANGLKYTADYDPTTGEITETSLRPVGGGGPLAERFYERADGTICAARTCLRSLSWALIASDQPVPAEELFETGQIGPSAEPVGRRLLFSREPDSAEYTFHRYDQLSNRSSFTCEEEDESVTALFNAERNRLLGIDAPAPCAERTHTYNYDDGGFVVERDGESIDWDGAGRIRGIGGHTEFAWDTSGRPLWRRIGAEVVRYRFGGRVEADADGEPSAIQHAEVRSDLRTGERLFRHYDFRGNVHLVSDDDGKVVRYLLYGAYGARAELGSEEDPFDFARGLRAGRLLVLGHRVLDPDAAAFLAPDPIHQLVNQYAYTQGNPVSFWDPDGRQARPTAPSTPSSQYAWGLFIGGMTLLGGAVGFEAGGPLGSAAGSLLGFSVANHIYQMSTGRQGVGFGQFIEEFSPLIVPRDGGPDGSSPSADAGMDIRPGEVEGYRRPGPARWHAPSRAYMVIDGTVDSLQVGGPACGLGFEVAPWVAVLALARTRRTSRSRRRSS
ncbi:MAG: RHS repeat domain-containing protein [Myxococcota bacterium]